MNRVGIVAALFVSYTIRGIIMKPLQRIIEDIKRGENIDLYTTVLVAIILAILNIIGLASPVLLNSLSLTVLALITSAILGNRHRLEDIQDKLVQSSETGITDEYPEWRDEDIERATEIWWFGVHALAFLRRYRKVIEGKLRKGSKVRVLLGILNERSCRGPINGANKLCPIRV